MIPKPARVPVRGWFVDGQPPVRGAQSAEADFVPL
jgi:hypothetical protein